MRGPAAFLDFADDAAADVVARQQLGRAACRLIALRIAPAFFLVARGLRSIGAGDVVEHEAPALRVFQHATLAAHAFGDENSANARRPHHPRRVKLHELHVDQFGAGLIGQRVAVAGVLPAIARDLVSAADAAGREHDRFGPEHLESSALALVAEGAHDASLVVEQRRDRAFHVHVDSHVDAVILQRSNHLEPCAVAHVSEARIPMAAEIALENPAVCRAIEQCAPCFELAHAIRRFLRVQLSHPPVVDVLATAHRVAEMHAPVVAVVHVRQRRRNAALGHHRMRFSQKRLAHKSDRDARRRGFDRRPETRAACSDHQHIVFVGLVIGHQKILTSDQMPIEHIRT